MRFRVLALSFVFHLDILFAEELALLGFLVFPLLSQSVWELFVDWYFDVCIFLDQNDAKVEVTVGKGDSERGVAIDIRPGNVGTSLKDVERANRAAPLGGVMERCLLPLVWYINVKMALGTETRDGLDRVDLGVLIPLLDLDKGIVKRDSTKVVSRIDINSKVYQELLDLECRVCCCT